MYVEHEGVHWTKLPHDGTLSWKSHKHGIKCNDSINAGLLRA